MFIFKFRSRFKFWFRFSFVGQALMQNHQQARITCFFDWLIDYKKMLFKSFRVSMCSSHVESSQVKSEKSTQDSQDPYYFDIAWGGLAPHRVSERRTKLTKHCFQTFKCFFSDVFQTDQIPSLCRGYQVIIQFQTCVSLYECSAIQNQTVWFVT